MTKQIDSLMRGLNEVTDLIDMFIEEQRTGVAATIPPLRPQPGIDASTVLQNPLITVFPAPETTCDRQRTNIASDGQHPGLSQYVDFRGKRRSLPRLNGESIRGILYVALALEHSFVPDADWFTQAALDAGDFRRSRGFRGANPCPESVELYVRVFRALGATLRQIIELDAQQLLDAYESFVGVSDANDNGSTDCR